MTNTKEYNAEYYRKNKERIAARRAALYAEDPLKHREVHLEKTYGMTQLEYLILLAEQNGECKGCGMYVDDNTGHFKKRRFDIDHDHGTGEVRGLLCANCNLTDVLS